jgi:hypothetical protein
MQEVHQQAVTGLIPPQSGEAIIRDVWPSIASRPAVAGLARGLTRTVVGAPLAWLVLLPFFVLSIAPFVARRYTLTNRRLMVRRWPQRRVVQEIPLGDIDEVRIRRDANSGFFRSGDLEILSQGKIVLTLPGVPEPDSFRHSIIQAYTAWVPGKTAFPFVPAKAPASA